MRDVALGFDGERPHDAGGGRLPRELRRMCERATRQSGPERVVGDHSDKGGREGVGVVGIDE